jgi:hypothetical protein
VCADPRVSVEGRLPEPFLEPVVRLCEELATLHDVDGAAHLRVVPASGGVIVEASLDDGRVAMRRVQDPKQLRATAEALLVLPPPPPAAPPPPPAPTVPARDRGSEPRRTDGLGFGIGLSILARLSRAPSHGSAGVGVETSVRAGDWRVGLRLRWEPTEELLASAPPGFEMDTVGAGFAVTRRFVRAESASLEAGITTTLVNETQSAQLGEDERAGAQTDVRAGVIARALIGSAPWYFVPSLEAEVSPGRVRRDIRIDDALPPLPSWSIALGLGVQWEAP